MRKPITLLIFLSSLLLFSQKKNNDLYSISGKVIDAETKKPLEYATVIIKPLDTISSLVGALTSTNGQFSIDIQKGMYTISIEYLSYKTKIFSKTTISNSINLGLIPLELNTEALNEISIKAEKKAIEFANNKLIFNVEKDISSSGSSAVEILNNIPSISVDPSGSISLRGQENVTVMINGKTSTMTKSEVLKSLPAGSIEKIEVITNPGSQYKATSGGIINIVLKKGKDEGLNASLTTSAGYKDSYGGLITLNYKSKKINFFTNTNYALSNPITIATSDNEYFSNGNTTSFMNEGSAFKTNKNNFNSTIGADIEISENTTITPTFNYSRLDNASTSKTNTLFYDTSKTVTTDNERDYKSDLNNEIYELIVDFQHKFNKEGRQLASYVQLTRDKEITYNKVSNSNVNFNSENYSQGFTINNTIFDLNYANPFGKFSNYTVGYMGEFGSFPYIYTGTSNHNDINYSENIHMAYVDYVYDNDQVYLNLGLRAEFQESNLKYLDFNTNFKRKANDIFPSASFSYQINDINAIDLSLSTGIQRLAPSYMQPYEEKISETSSYIGNEKLAPVYIKKSSLTYTHTKGKFTLSTNLFYEIYDDYWEKVTYETGETINGVQKILTTPFNIGKLYYSGINISPILKVNNSLSFTGNFLLFNFNEKGFFETINTNDQTIYKNFDNSNTTGSASLLVQLKIPTLFDIQTNIKHQLKSNGLYFSRKEYTYANLAINKELFNGNASLSLVVDDLFKSIKQNRNRFDESYFSKAQIKNKYRSIILSFTYRFNQSKQDRKIDFNKKDIKPNY